MYNLYKYMFYVYGVKTPSQRSVKTLGVKKPYPCGVKTPGRENDRDFALMGNCC